GTVVIVDDGQGKSTFTYTPNKDYIGPDSFVYEVCDTGTPQACDEATVVLTVNPLNTTDAIPDINNTYVDTKVQGNVLTNDEDEEGNTQKVNLTNSDSASKAGGIVTLNPNGSYVYTPPTGFTGTDTFNYEICDDGTPQACDTTTVTIEVMPSTSTTENNDVVANDDTTTTEEGDPVSGDLLANDFDPDKDTITINTTPVEDPSNGTVTIDPDGTFTYTPDAGFVGEDTFVYEICDEAGACDKATVTVSVNPDDNGANDTYANDDAYNGNPNQDITGNVLINDEDPEGDIPEVNTTLKEDPKHGTVTITKEGDFTYTPDEDYVGPDSFVYEVCDTGTPKACDEATVVLTVNPLNTTDAIPDINNTFMDTLVEGNVLTNDKDEEGDTPEVQVDSSDKTSAEGGTVTIKEDGTYTYTPPVGFTGTDTFTYEMCDNGTPQACDTSTVTIEVLSPSAPSNDVVANDDTATTEEGTPVSGNLLANDFDPDKDDFTINTTPTEEPSHGTVTISPDGKFTYEPEDGFEGEDTFVYEICDINGACDEATVTVSVDPNDGANDTYANDDASNGVQNENIVGNVLANDEDPEGDVQTVNTTPLTDPSHGTVTITKEGDFTYTPDEDYVGPDSFVYEVCDVNGACDKATVILTVKEGEVLAGCLRVYNIITPNGDGDNDTLVIQCIEDYPGSTLSIFNRWGNTVYTATDYKNDWSGTSNGRATIYEDDLLPSGTYYYVLDFKDGKTPVKKGWIQITR
ncbi:Ig-like domain-containing protein, partial [Tenacibaculum sp. UWU-22]|uniref:Ig-like domain-containing protein n=1 Tax=Tenacibaculum sp. UWU-22 TaxID=3234187 RepID=UPI0034DB2EA1